jgi:hypothetical protein
MLKKLLAYLAYGGTARLRTYELACIDSMKALLPPNGASVLEQQMSLVELVQRYSNDRVVLVHFPENGKEAVPLFPNRSEECRAARVQLRSTSGKAVTADVVFHSGRLSSIEFSRAPRKLLESGFSAGTADLLQDMTGEAPPMGEGSVDIQAGSVLAEIGREGRLEKVVGPAPEKDVSAFLSILGAVPADYTALLRETNGFAMGQWRFMGTRARRVILPSEALWLVAETGELALCFAEGSAEPTVLFYDQIDDDCRATGQAFVPALLGMLSSTGREP